MGGGNTPLINFLKKTIHMARNTLAGKHKSYDKRGMSDEQIKKKKEYDKNYHATKERKKYRAELNRENKKRGTYGNKDGKDVSHHKKKGKYSQEPQSKNRARQGANGKSTKK